MEDNVCCRSLSCGERCILGAHGERRLFNPFQTMWKNPERQRTEMEIGEAYEEDGRKEEVSPLGRKSVSRPWNGEKYTWKRR